MKKIIDRGFEPVWPKLKLFHQINSFFFFFFFLAVDLLHSIFLFYWMIMKMGWIVDDAEEFPCGDGLLDRAVIHASYHNYP